MENTDFYTLSSSPSFSHLLESEEDFHFGAKTTSFLPPAITDAAVSPTTAAYDLPEWMEGQGLPSTFEDLLQSSPLQGGSPTQLKEEDYCSTIKPEDMLVPLSELQPPPTPASPPLANTPPVSPAHVPISPSRVPISPAHVPISPARVPVSPVPATTTTSAPANAPLPKIIICRKVTSSTLKSKPVQVHYQVIPVKNIPQGTPGTSLPLETSPQIPMFSGKSHEDQVGVMHLGGSYEEPQASNMPLAVPQSTHDIQVPQACDAEQLINEMVQMIGSGNGGFQDLDSAALDSSMMVANMDDLLSQLETSETDSTNTHSEPQALSPPACLPISSPSEFSAPAPAPSPHHPEYPLPASPISLPSPVPSLGSLSPAQSSSDCLSPYSEASPDRTCMEEEWSPLQETHSYSRSQRKARPSRRTPTARKAPYVEDRKERKKEQNKQAALRYRQKKKQEEDVLMEKVHKEEERQEKLKTTYSGLKQELSYLKKIMREVFIARGLLSEEALKKAVQEKHSSRKPRIVR